MSSAPGDKLKKINDALKDVEIQLLRRQNERDDESDDGDGAEDPAGNNRSRNDSDLFQRRKD